MKFLITLILSLSAVVANAAAANDPITTAKSAFDTARFYLQVYVKDCLADSVGCQLTDAEKTLLAGVLFDAQNEGSLNYISASQNPGRFESAGTHRIAATGLRRRDPIYVNTDELSSIDFPSAVAILTHEFGHHEGVTDTDDRVLDVLGSKVREFMLAHAENSTLKDSNQPAAGMILYNSPGERVSGASSQIFVYDHSGVLSLSNLLDQKTNCPLGLTRQGGIYISQLRGEGSFDWDIKAQSQDFGFRAEMQVLCMGGPKPEVVFYTLRFSIPLAPDSGPSQEGWWKSQVGHLIAAPDLSLFDRGYVDYERIFQIGSGLPLKVLKVENPRPVLVGGDTWSLKATVESPAPLNFESCRADFTSKSFVNFGYKPRTTIDFSSCQLKPLGANRFEVQLTYTFPKLTPARNYQLYSIELKMADQEYALLGVPVFPVQIALQSSAQLSPLKIAMVGLAYRGANGKGGFIDPNIDGSKPNSYQVANSSLFAFQFLISSMSPILDSSGLSTEVAWSDGKRELQYGWIIPLRDSFKYGWGIPLNGGTDVQPYPGASGKYVFSLSLRGHAESGAASANTMRSVQLRFLYLMNESLQEDFEYTPIQVIGK